MTFSVCSVRRFAPNLLSPSVPFAAITYRPKIVPTKGIKKTRHSQPLLFKSCKRRMVMQIVATNMAMTDTTMQTIAEIPSAELNKASILRSGEVKTASKPMTTVMPKAQVYIMPMINIHAK